MATPPTGTTALQADETQELISADKVEGTPVYNRAGEKLGTIDNIMIDKRSGRVAYAVMSFGGFLGLADRRHALPWNALHYDTREQGYIVDMDRDKLEEAPSFSREKVPDWDDPDFTQGIHDYYGVRPTWL